MFPRFPALIALTLLPLAPATAQDPARMDQVARADVDRDEFAGAILVARDGKLLLDKGYGLANREWNIPNDGATRFRMASVTKQFTAVSVLLLHDRGKIDLDAPVKTYLADAPAAWDAVTVRHVLNHTSGIANFTSFPDYFEKQARPTTANELIARFRDKPLDFAPGAGWAYSNSGYVVATAIIEKVSGQSYADFVTANIFQPLGMTDSGYDDAATILPHRAAGYSPTKKGVANSDFVDMSVPQGAGGLYSTTRDLLKWQRGLYGGRFLRAETLAALTTPGRNDYALGVNVKATGDRRLYSHSGGINGFNAYLAFDPDAKITVAVLGNLNGPAAARLGVSMMALARGESVTLPSERKAITVAPATLRQYAGTYRVNPTRTIAIAFADGKLTAQLSGQQPNEIFAEAPDRFFLRVVDAQVSFNRDTAGTITGLILHQGGRDMPATKE